MHARVIPLCILLLTGLARGQEDRLVVDATQVAFSDLSRVLNTLDLNGDGIPDAVGWWGITSREVVVEGFVNDGTGVFTRAFSITDWQSTARRAIWSMGVGGFDRDNRDDFVTRFGDEVKVYSSASSGGATQTAFWRLPPGSGGCGLVVADFDGDGLDDLALDLATDLRLYRNTGTGLPDR